MSFRLYQKFGEGEEQVLSHNDAPDIELTVHTVLSFLDSPVCLWRFAQESTSNQPYQLILHRRLAGANLEFFNLFTLSLNPVFLSLVSQLSLRITDPE